MTIPRASWERIPVDAITKVVVFHNMARIDLFYSDGAVRTITGLLDIDLKELGHNLLRLGYFAVPSRPGLGRVDTYTLKG